MSSKSTLTELSNLAKSSCSNFINGKCMGDRGCPLFNMTVQKGLRCKYFEECVLPINKELQEKYSAEVLGVERTLESKRCKHCKKTFKTGNYRLQYCSDYCKSKAKNKSNRKSRLARKSASF
ncbi:MAG: hypothetical protein ACQEWW_07765 [Bacillota bacterium]